MKRKASVLMTKSVGSLAAGKRVKLALGLADEFIAKGYADGELSREYTDEERAALLGPTQIVSL